MDSVTWTFTRHLLVKVVEGGRIPLRAFVLGVYRVLGTEAPGRCEKGSIPVCGLVPFVFIERGTGSVPSSGQGPLMVLLATFQLVFSK